MAIATYKKIASITVGSGGSSVLEFDNIPNTYDDLIIKLSLRQNQGNPNAFPLIRFNSSSSNLSERWLAGDGSSSSSGTDSVRIFWNATKDGGETASTFASDEIYIPNYKSSVNKPLSIDNVMENNATAARAWLVGGLWSDTSAINNIKIYSGDNTASPAYSFVQHSTATLYGIVRSN